MEDNVVIKGIPQEKKDTIWFKLLVGGLILLGIALAVSIYVFYYGRGYSWYSGDSYYYFIIYTFPEFFLYKFLDLECVFGYLIIISVIILIAGVVIKKKAENCEIVVTDNEILGTLPQGKNVNIPLDQITEIKKCTPNGVSIASIGRVNNFYCMTNYEEIINEIAKLLANMKNNIVQTSEVQQDEQPTFINQTAGTNSEIEQLKDLKVLLDMELITQDEFELKKKEILGL